MKLCTRGVNFFQIYDDLGNVRMCSWTKDGYLGSLITDSFQDLYHGEIANKLYDRLSKDDYRGCNRDDCPWLACGDINEHKVEVESIPMYPEKLCLAYENICNYNCSTCNIHERMKMADKKELERRYDIIEEKIREILPYVKHISANGQGEVFVSNRILKILNEWKPIAPKEECEVSLETNGSLFDEEHFKLIKNLWEYKINVAITVMSFNEKIYQQLSGTKLPISQIENNLRYVKSLREKGIINHIEIATVVQERNFRELPEFVKRSIEEFGADSVRLRSFVPWGKKPIEDEWFTDVINPYHPYHQEYLEVMKNPIFMNPKVDDWSGGIGTTLGEHPYKKRLDIAEKKVKILSRILLDRLNVLSDINSKVKGYDRICIYGLGEIGKALTELLENHELYIIDNYKNIISYQELPVYKFNDLNEESIQNDFVIISVLGELGEIEKQLIKAGYRKDNIIRIDELLAEV